jgi:Lrp/AsnC family leucine-responsive transcriptional regulator
MAFNPNGPLDETDWAILQELQRNARVTWSELGRRVSLTPPAVAERVRRMEETGVITGYRVELDLARVGLPVTAFVRMRASGELNCRELGHHAKDIPEVMECHRVTGDDSYIMRVAVRSVEHLEELIDRLMPYAETITSLVLSTPVGHRVIDPATLGPPPAEQPETENRSRARSA